MQLLAQIIKFNFSKIRFRTRKAQLKKQVKRDKKNEGIIQTFGGEIMNMSDNNDKNAPKKLDDPKKKIQPNKADLNNGLALTFHAYVSPEFEINVKEFDIGIISNLNDWSYEFMMPLSLIE